MSCDSSSARFDSKPVHVSLVPHEYIIKINKAAETSNESCIQLIMVNCCATNSRLILIMKCHKSSLTSIFVIPSFKYNQYHTSVWRLFRPKTHTRDLSVQNSSTSVNTPSQERIYASRLHRTVFTHGKQLLCDHGSLRL